MATGVRTIAIPGLSLGALEAFQAGLPLAKVFSKEVSFLQDGEVGGTAFLSGLLPRPASPLSQNVSADLLNRVTHENVPPEQFVHDLQQDPVGQFLAFQKNEPSLDFARNRPLHLRLLADLNERLLPGSVLEREEFKGFRKRFIDLQDRAVGLYQEGLPRGDFSNFVMDYVNLFDDLFCSTDFSLTGKYHQDFSKRLVGEVLNPQGVSQAFFSCEPVDDLYFWDIRPAAIYLQWLVVPPSFNVTASSYKGGPVVDREALTRYIDGLELPPKEITCHDIGHSYYMKRQDDWLFETLDETPGALVKDWCRTKDAYKQAWRALCETDPVLGRAVQFLLSEVIHERGYQFYLPILHQQFSSTKWAAMIGFKKGNRYWGDQGITDEEFSRLEEARCWLLTLTDELLIERNTRDLHRFDPRRKKIMVRHWQPLETYKGIPASVEIKGIRDVVVSFNVPGTSRKSTSLYEVGLVLAPKDQNPRLTPEKIDLIERAVWQMNHSDEMASISLFPNGEIHLSVKGKRNLPEPPETLQDKDRFSPIELYKLERLLYMIDQQRETSFTVTPKPKQWVGTILDYDSITLEFTFRDDSGRIYTSNLRQASFHEARVVTRTIPANKYINLNEEDRFLSEETLRASYERYGESLNPTAPPYVTINRKVRDRKTGEMVDLELELAIADTAVPEIARAVSSLLARSLEDAKYTNGGYLPPDIVKRVQTELISPYAVHQRWGKVGRRFVLSRRVAPGVREVIGSALLGESRDDIFFFTSRFNNLKHSLLRVSLDFALSIDGHPDHRWFDKFWFPDLERYKPKDYHHLANFVIEREGVRGLGLSRLFIESVIEHYSRSVLKTRGNLPEHSQRLLCGSGLWQIGDPPWLARMGRLGFTPRFGAESFHIDQPWDPLIPTLDANGNAIDHVTYNRQFGLPQFYQELVEGHEGPFLSLYQSALLASSGEGLAVPGDHLVERVPDVLAMATSGRAKIQYFQLIFPFEDYLLRGSRRNLS